LVSSVAALLVEERSAKAAEPPPSGDASWYGYQNLICDAAALGALSVGVLTLKPRGPSVLLPAGGVIGYLACSPIVHLVHANRRAAWKSLLWRGVFPVAGAALGTLGAVIVVAARPKKGDDGCHGVECVGADLSSGMLIGLGLGALAASALDAASYAYEPRYVLTISPSQVRATELGTALRVVPWFSQNLLGVSVVGRY
jgi:hypothetical protein